MSVSRQAISTAGSGSVRPFSFRGPIARKWKPPLDPIEPGDEVAGQDLAASCLVTEPAGHDHHGAVKVALVLDRLAGVEAHPEVEFPPGRLLEVVLVDGPLDLDGTAGGLHRAGEGRHQPVAQSLDLVPAGRGQCPTNEREVHVPKLLGCVVPETLQQFRRPHQVGKEQGHDPRGADCHRAPPLL